MPINYTAGAPRTNNYPILPAGEYPFRVLDASEALSKSGNKMIKLKIAAGDGKTADIVLFDYLVFTESSVWKVDAFLKSCGMHPGEGKEATIKADEFIGWEGRVKVVVEDYNGDKQNKVASYTWPSSDDF